VLQTVGSFLQLEINDDGTDIRIDWDADTEIVLMDASGLTLTASDFVFGVT